MTEPICIIDSHALCHMVKHRMGHFTFEEQKVGIIYGFLRQIFSLSKKLQTTKFVFVWDSRKSYRKELLPTYKSGRAAQIRHKPEVDALNKIAYPQFTKLRQYVLPTIGFKNSFIQTGCEADDLIAIIAKDPNNIGHKMIVSADTDLYQLLSVDTSLCKPGSKFRIYTVKSFQKDFCIDPSEWAMVKQIAGCPSDSVPGITGVGEKTAIKFLKGNLSRKTKAYEAIVSQEGRSLAKFNERLVKLPFEATKPLKLQWDYKLYVADFLKILEEYGMKSISRNDVLDTWIEQFKMV